MVHIRPLEARDSIEELTRLLHRGYARLGEMGLNYTAVDQTSETTKIRMARGRCFVAESEGRLIGTVLCKHPEVGSECDYFRRPTVASLRQFAVDPTHQGQGVGKSLIEACETWARQEGYVELALDTAEPATHLVALYAKQGYRHVGMVQWSGKVYRSVIMSKALR
jgi:GNAT superfamily N-acetyltransferase